MKLFPTLYKKTNTGAIQYWKIKVVEVCECQIYKPEGHEKFMFIPQDDPRADGHSDADDQQFAGEIVTEYGQINTDSPQITKDLIADGKSAGKKNATTAWEQAQKDTQAKWEKQKKKGYVEDVESAQAGEIDTDVIKGGVFPMLAQKFAEHSQKIIYPCFVQPKLDGMRCIATVIDGKCTLWSRTRKPILSAPHIIVELEETFEGQTITLDGELYNHTLHNDFERIMSLARQSEPGEGHTDIQYHIYDKITDGIFADRINELQNDLAMCPFNYVKLLTTSMARDAEEITAIFISFRAQGYEGLIVRNAEGKYTVNKRSYDLQKLKEFIDAEFDIVGIEKEGSGRLQGHVGSFTCKTEDGTEFGVKMEGKQEKLKQYFDDHSLWKGKQLTVTYQRITNKSKVPLHPVGSRIREQE